MHIKKVLPRKKIFLNVLSVFLLTGFLVTSVAFILSHPLEVLNAQTTSYWNVERDGSNNLNFSFTNSGSAGAVGLQLLPTGLVTSNTQVTAKQGFTTGYANLDSGLTGQRPYQFGYQEGGAWTTPFPDLILGYHTGVKIGGNFNYGGTKFFNDHPSMTGATQLFSVGDGDNNVRVANYLHFPNSSSTGVSATLNSATLSPNTGSYGAWKVGGSRSGWAGIEFDVPTTPAGAATLMVGHPSQTPSNMYTGVHLNGSGWLWYASGHDLHAGDATVANGSIPAIPAGNVYGNMFIDNTNGAYYLDPAGSSNLNGATFASGPYTNDWFRANGSNGLYFQSYGGGWHMVDSTYIRSYGNKPILVPLMYDQDNAGYYSDPSNLTYLNTLNTAGNVGIGTTAPQGRLGVNFGNGDQIIFMQVNDDGLGIQTTLNGQPNNGYGGHTNNRLTLQPTTGVVGIHSSYPNADLHIKQSDNSQGGTGGIKLERSDTGGFARIFEGGDQQLYLWTNSNAQYCIVTLSASIACASDQRLKENIRPLSISALDTIKKLKPSTFDWKQGKKNSAGFIAQEVEKVLPEAITRNESDGYYSVSDSYFTPYIVKSIQELDEKNNATQIEIADLKKKLQEQTNVNASQSEQISVMRNELDELKKAIKGAQNNR